jgi:Ca2+/Na+ antiporter
MASRGNSKETQTNELPAQTLSDTFASKVAAIQDDTADASVGNVTGSNAVNVFLGIGIAWSLAAIYWTAQGEQFEVPVGRFELKLGAKL